MTPTEQDIAFFTSEEAKGIQEEWEPRFGDWVSAPLGVMLIVQIEDLTITVESVSVVETYYQDEIIFLPRPDQLWEMIKAQGLKPGMVETSDEKGNPSGVYAFATHPIDGDIFWEADGPTPSTALGRALIE